MAEGGAASLILAKGIVTGWPGLEARNAQRLDTNLAKKLCSEDESCYWQQLEDTETAQLFLFLIALETCNSSALIHP